MRRIALWISVCALVATSTAAATAADTRKKLEVDASSMILLTDGDGHYIAVRSKKGQIPDYYKVYYGADGKRFYEVPVVGGGSDSGTGEWEFYFRDQRLNQRWGYFDLKDGKYVVKCGDNNTEVQLVVAEEAKKVLANAVFFRNPHEWMAFALGRDEHGNYYYVDRGRFPENERAFRVFIGPKGNMKLQKLSNVVNDSEGSIFATPSGTLRLILHTGEYVWVQKSDREQLVKVPVEKNLRLIYDELGVYSGARLGTPCDDL